MIKRFFCFCRDVFLVALLIWLMVMGGIALLELLGNTREWLAFFSGMGAGVLVVYVVGALRRA